MKRLLIFLKGYEKESFLAPLFKMLEATFELIVPLVVARIMDIGIKNQDNVYIWHQCVIMVLLGVIGLACSLTAQYFSAKDIRTLHKKGVKVYSSSKTHLTLDEIYRDLLDKKYKLVTKENSSTLLDSGSSSCTCTPK